MILFGSFIWSLTMVKSGLIYSYGIGFWGPNGHDGIWHLSLITGLARGSFGMPIFAGELIKNYHIGFDLLVAVLHLISDLPVSFLYFQILPPLLALGVGWSVMGFLKAWKKDDRAIRWGLFFTYFGGSFGWLVSLIRNGQTGGESMFWSQQSISTLLNPPFALSLIIVFFSLTSLLKYQRHPTKTAWLISVILFGFLLEIKVYAGILALGSLLVISVYEFLTEKKTGLLRIFLGSLVISLIIFLPFNRNSQSLIVLRPGWFLETMLIYSDRFYWPRLYHTIVDSRQLHNWPKSLLGYFLALFIFLIGNLGTRVLALIAVIKNRKPDIVSLFIYSFIFGGLLLPMLFLQKGTPWNTIQFFYYSQIFLGILAALFISGLFGRLNHHKYFRYAIWLLIIIVTIPTTLDTLDHYLPSRPPAMISKDELQALNKLASLPPGNVFTYPIQPDAYYPPPRPLYYYDSTAYVSAYSGHPVFMEDTVNLNITGFDWPRRQAQSEEFIAMQNINQAREFLHQNRIKYIYLALVAKYRPFLTASQLGGKIIFENSQASIWQVDTN